MKKRFKITITFFDNDDGDAYELSSIVMITKPIDVDRAKELAIITAHKCWPNYDIAIEGLREIR